MLRIKRLRRKTRRNRKAMLKKAAVAAPAAILIILVVIGLVALAVSLFKPETPAKKPPVKRTAVTKTVKPNDKKPSLIIDSPVNGSSTDETSVIIKGRTDTDGTLTLNGTKIPVNNDGSFNFFFSLVYGMNTCQIKVTNKSGKVTEKEISINSTRPPKSAESP